MTSISKNVYIYKLDDIVNEYNNTYHITIKTNPIDVKDNTYSNTDKEANDKDSKFKKITKKILLKAMLQIDQKKFL